MPSKQKNKPSHGGTIPIHHQQQQQHAHTISRATNLHYLQNNKQQYLYSNNNQQQYYHQAPNNINLNLKHQHQQMIKNGAATLNPHYFTQTYNNEPPLISGSSGATIQDRTILMHKQLHESLMSTIERQAMLNKPLCRCRVMYLGSSVPHITKNGLHGIQEPLRHLYPEEQFNSNSSNSSSSGEKSASTALMANDINQPQIASNTIDISHLSSGLGIDSWLSVWSNGLLLENFDEFGREIKRFFSIESLHYCAAVRFFDTTTLMSPNQRFNNSKTSPVASQTNGGQTSGDQNNNIVAQEEQEEEFLPSLQQTSANNNTIGQQQQQRPAKSMVRFLPLDAPLFQCPGMIDANHPPVFAAIMRRTTGIKVLECHAFICRRDAASNALVRCCTQAYADLLATKRLSLELGRVVMTNGAMYNDQYGATKTTSDRHHHHQRSSRSQHGTRRTSNYSSKQSLWSPYESVTVEASVNNRQRLLPSIGIMNDASNEENSIEGSSEDNYAIISKHHFNQQQQQVDPNNQHLHHHQQVVSGGRTRGSKSKNTADKQRKGSSSGSRRSNNNINNEHTQRSKIGSSKSLFTDFMPKHQESRSVAKKRQSSGSNAIDMEKLSHSVELFELEGATCCGNIGKIGDGDKGSIKYSLVGKNANKNSTKRHSRSMQNLNGPYEFSAEVATRNSQRRHRKSGHKSSSSATAAAVGGDRRSASYHDISGELMNQHLQSQRLTSKVGSELTVRSSTQSLINDTIQPLPPVPPPVITTANNNNNNNNQPPPPPPLPPLEDPAYDSGSRIYGELGNGLTTTTTSTKRRSSKHRQQQLHDYPEQSQNVVGGESEKYLTMMMNGHHQPSATTCRRESKFSVSRRRDRSQQRRSDLSASMPFEPVPHPSYRYSHLSSQPQLHPNNYPNGAPFPVQPQQALYPQPPTGPAPGGLYLPYYLPPAVYQHPSQFPPFQYHHHPQQLTAAAVAANPHQQPIYGSLYNDPAAATNPYYQQQQQQQQQQHYSGGPTSGPPNGTMRKSSSQHKSMAAKTLASGFRCLSPPMNFLSSLKRQSTASEVSQQQRDVNRRDSSANLAVANNGSQLPQTNHSQTQAQQQNLTTDNSMAIESISSGNEQQQKEHGAEELPTAVVSARPGFLLSSAATAAARDKKMSWIKRLSLTMSSSNSSQQQQQHCTSPDPMSSPAAINGINGGQKQAKKRSSLFSGSLTIGRRANRQQNGSKILAS